MADSKNIQLGKSKLLQTPLNEINKSFIEDMFAAYYDKEANVYKEANFDPTSKITLTSNEYQWVVNPTSTTLGMLLFNRYVLEQYNIIRETGYWNTPLSKKGLGKLDELITSLVIADKLTTVDLGNYVDSRDRLGFWCASFLGSAVSDSLLRPMSDVKKRKAELFKQYDADLHSNDSVKQILTVNKIEKELNDMVEKNLMNDAANDIFNSGIYNRTDNYKVINVMTGAVFNPSTGKYDIVENSLMDGINKKDIPAFANSVVAGAYPSAVGTADSGYMAKQVLALLQSEELDPNPKSDCGTKSTIPMTVDKDSAPYLYYRNIIVNGKVVELTADNINNYMGKTVQLCSPQCCTHDKICAKCAGRLFYNLGVTRVGLLCSQITQKLLNIKLKSKHNSLVTATVISLDKGFLSNQDKLYIKDGMLYNKTKMKIFVPRIKDESEQDAILVGFERETTHISCLGILPVKFYDKSDKEIGSTMMTIPCVVSLLLYGEVQEEPDNLIISYEPDSPITRLAIQQTAANVEFFINQIYLYSKIAQLPYNMMTELMFICMSMNKTDLTGPSIIYELLARRVCRMENGDTFAKIYGKDSSVDQFSYKKANFRTLVQESNALSGLLFQDVSGSVRKGLASTLNGKKQVDTPLEQIIRL